MTDRITERDVREKLLEIADADPEADQKFIKTGLPDVFNPDKPEARTSVNTHVWSLAGSPPGPFAIYSKMEGKVKYLESDLSVYSTVEAAVELIGE
jgi:hypothetical protein